MRYQDVKRAVAVALVACVAATSAGRGTAGAMMVPGDAAAAEMGARKAADLQTIRAALENRVVRQRLADLGLSPEQVDRRLGRMSPERLHQVAKRIERQNPAGADVGVIAIVLGVLLLLFLLASLGDDDDDDDDNDNEDEVQGGGAQTIIVK